MKLLPLVAGLGAGLLAGCAETSSTSSTPSQPVPVYCRNSNLTGPVGSGLALALTAAQAGTDPHALDLPPPDKTYPPGP